MASRRRGDNPKLHMDRQPTAARITDPSVPAGKRREIDNVMKKARANTNDYWDKKLLEVEEKDPNRWRHTGYKKMYIQGESSSGDSDRDGAGTSRDRRSTFRMGYKSGASSPALENVTRGRPRSPPPRGIPPRYNQAPGIGSNREFANSRIRSRSPMHDRRVSPSSSLDGVSRGRPRTPIEAGRRPVSGRPHSPLEPMRRNRSPLQPEKRGILPRSKRPPSPPPRHSILSRSNSSLSSSSDDSCSLCSPSHRRRSRSASVRRCRPPVGNGPRSPPPKSRSNYRNNPPPLDSHLRLHSRPLSPPSRSGGNGARNAIDKYRESKMRRSTRERSVGNISHEGHVKVSRSGRHSPPEDPRLKNRPPEPPQPSSSSLVSTSMTSKKKKKEKEVRTRIKIEGEKRKKHSSSDSDDSAGSDTDEGSLPSFSATTRLTLSERFGKMAQWSIDRSNMENMRITKDSVGGALKVMIEEGLESPPRRYEYSPAPAGHFPEELATTAPSGMLSWDDVRVRYEYYKSRGYLRDLDLKDYIKWEEWWYKYQEWLKQERYYEYWDRQSLRRRRKKLPVTQRLN